MQMAAEWLEAVEAIQQQVVFEFGLEEKHGLWLLRSATHLFPELGHIAIYVRNNLARDGKLQCGDMCENIPLIDLMAQPHPLPDTVEPCIHLHTVAAKAPLTVLCAGSFT